MESDWVSRRHAGLFIVCSSTLYDLYDDGKKMLFLCFCYSDMYNLVKWRTRYQEQYIQYTADLVTLLHQLRSFNKEEVIPLDVQQRTWDLVITGFKLMGDWTAKVKEQIVYKATNPIDEAKYKILGGLGGKSQVYEQITRFNYDNDLKYAMVETIGLIKGYVFVVFLLLSASGVVLRFLHLVCFWIVIFYAFFLFCVCAVWQI